MAKTHSVVREGIVTGVIGATVVALVFLLIDIVAAHAFYTPETLGRSVLSILGPPFDDSTFSVVAIYTVIHYAAFVIVGMIAVAIVHAGLRESSVLAGALILFVVMGIGFYGFTALLTESPLGGLAWYQIGLANLLAAIAMGIYLFKTHPALSSRLDHALGGGERPPAGPRERRPEVESHT